MDTGINIGANGRTIEAAMRAILAFINSKNTDQVKIAACEAFTKTCSVSNTTVSYCTFNGGGKSK